MSESKLTKSRLEALEAENSKLKEELEFQKMKHNQWKSQAMMFHDTLWKLIDKYIPQN